MTAYIDPDIRAVGRRERTLLAAIRARGLRLDRVNAGTLRLSGPGIHILTTDLATLSLADLEPPGAAARAGFQKGR